MRGLSRRIMEHAEALQEATPLCPASLLHLGNRAAVDRRAAREPTRCVRRGCISARVGVSRSVPDRHSGGADLQGEGDTDACLLPPRTRARRASVKAPARSRAALRGRRSGERHCRSRACPFCITPQGDFLHREQRKRRANRLSGGGFGTSPARSRRRHTCRPRR